MVVIMVMVIAIYGWDVSRDEVNGQSRPQVAERDRIGLALVAMRGIHHQSGSRRGGGGGGPHSSSHPGFPLRFMCIRLLRLDISMNGENDSRI